MNWITEKILALPSIDILSICALSIFISLLCAFLYETCDKDTKD